MILCLIQIKSMGEQRINFKTPNLPRASSLGLYDFPCPMSSRFKPLETVAELSPRWLCLSKGMDDWELLHSWPAFSLHLSAKWMWSKCSRHGRLNNGAAFPCEAQEYLLRPTASFSSVPVALMAGFRLGGEKGGSEELLRGTQVTWLTDGLIRDTFPRPKWSLFVWVGKKWVIFSSCQARRLPDLWL